MCVCVCVCVCSARSVSPLRVLRFRSCVSLALLASQNTGYQSRFRHNRVRTLLSSHYPARVSRARAKRSITGCRWCTRCAKSCGAAVVKLARACAQSNFRGGCKYGRACGEDARARQQHAVPRYACASIGAWYTPRADAKERRQEQTAATRAPLCL